MCSGANVEMVKSLGADKVIDYTKEDFTKNGKTYDLIFDIVGATTFDRCQKSLKPRGVFLQNIMGLADLVRVLWTSITGRKKIKGGVAMENLERMNFTVELATAGKLKAVIDRSYPLERIAEAFKYVEQGHKKGNVVIASLMNAPPLSTGSQRTRTAAHVTCLRNLLCHPQTDIGFNTAFIFSACAPVRVPLHRPEALAHATIWAAGVNYDRCIARTQALFTGLTGFLRHLRVSSWSRYTSYRHATRVWATAPCA